MPLKHGESIARSQPIAPEATWTLALLLLCAFRLVNAYFVQTFFQPDEYFQSLEPAWDLAFGPDSGAWLTWVRETCNGLRLIARR
jgi:phosphatidylinositol glycan class B